MSLTLFPTAGVNQANPSLGDFTEGLDPARQGLVGGVPFGPDMQAMLSHLMGPAQQFKPMIQPPLGSFNEALNPASQMVGGVPYGTDPGAMSPSPMGPPQGFTGATTPAMPGQMPTNQTAQVPMPPPRPPMPLASPGMGKGALTPFAAPGMGKGAAPHHRRQAVANYLMGR